MTNDFEADMRVVYDSLTIDHTDGAIVRYTTPSERTNPKVPPMNVCNA